MKSPLISVLMPVYNNRTFLVQAVESIINQSCQDFELMIVDDASTDATWELIVELQKKYPTQIRAFHLDKNSGAFVAANFALARATGKYIAVMDSDDVASPERFAKQINFLEKNPEIIVVGSQVNLINENNELLGTKVLPTDDQQIYQDFGIVHPMVHPACMIRRAMLPDPNCLYKIKFGVNDDYYTFFSLLSLGKFANLDENLFSYRIHMGNSSLVNLKSRFFTTARIRLAARKEFGYKLSMKSSLLMGLQTVIVLCIPQKYLFKAYLVCRGISSPSQAFSRVSNKVKYEALKPHFAFLRQEV